MATKTIVRYRTAKTKRTHSKRKFTLPLAIVAGLTPYVWHEYDLYKSGGLGEALKYASKPFVPIDPFSGKFDTCDLKWGLIPMGVGIGVHMIANKLGLNRMLGRAGIPFIRI